MLWNLLIDLGCINYTFWIIVFRFEVAFCFFVWVLFLSGWFLRIFLTCQWELPKLFLEASRTPAATCWTVVTFRICVCWKGAVLLATEIVSQTTPSQFVSVLLQNGKWRFGSCYDRSYVISTPFGCISKGSSYLLPLFHKMIADPIAMTKTVHFRYTSLGCFDTEDKRND